MSDRDKWITKEQAKDLFEGNSYDEGYFLKIEWENGYVVGATILVDKILAAINALKPVAEVQDAVSRDETIRAIRGYKPERKMVRRDAIVSDLVRLISLSPVLPARPDEGRIGQEPKDKPDHKAMWKELRDRPDTSLALRDVMKEIKTKHTPKPEKPEGENGGH